MQCMKKLTFSYDDGVTQDRRLIELFNKYNVKATFNLNSGLLGRSGELVREGKTVSHNKNKPEDIKYIYDGHEIAAHTLTHPLLTALSDEEVIRQVEEDRLKLSDLAGYEVVGMAYPGGKPNYDERCAKLIAQNTGVLYARTTVSSYNFDKQRDLYVFRPTVYHHGEWDKLFELGEQFIRAEASKPQIFYVWGHSYEFDIHDTWDKFEEFLKLISGKKDVFYGANKEVLL